MKNIYDVDGDGKISNNDIHEAESIIELENRDKKEDQQRRMAWIAMWSMLVFTLVLFTPFIDVERIKALDNILGMFYIAQAGIVATFFGAQAYINR